MKNASREEEPTMAEYDRTLAVVDRDGYTHDLPTFDGHQATCKEREGRHAPGCLHAPDCAPGVYAPTESGLGCGCGLPGWPREGDHG